MRYACASASSRSSERALTVFPWPIFAGAMIVSILLIACGARRSNTLRQIEMTGVFALQSAYQPRVLVEEVWKQCCSPRRTAICEQPKASFCF